MSAADARSPGRLRVVGARPPEAYVPRGRCVSCAHGTSEHHGPDELLEQARAADLNISRLASAALVEELDRRAKVAELDAYLANLEAEFGPVPPDEAAAAREWADRVLPVVHGVPGTGEVDPAGTG